MKSKPPPVETKKDSDAIKNGVEILNKAYSVAKALKLSHIAATIQDACARLDADPLAPEAPGVETELSNVDLADEMSGMIPTEIGYKANLKTIQTRDEMIGTLLDTLA